MLEARNLKLLMIKSFSRLVAHCAVDASGQQRVKSAFFFVSTKNLKKCDEL